MSTAARLRVDTLDVDHSEGVSWHDTTLVKRESEFELGFLLVHETLGDVVPVVNQTVGSVLDLLLLISCQTLEMSDVQMCFLLSLFGTSLPDVRSQDLTAGGKDNMCSSVMSLKLRTSCSVYGSICCLANRIEVGWKLLANLVEHALSDLNTVDNIEDLVNTLDSHSSCVILLTTRSRVEATLIENDQVTFVFFELIGKDLNDLSSEVHLVGVVEVDTFGLCQM